MFAASNKAGRHLSAAPHEGKEGDGEMVRVTRPNLDLQTQLMYTLLPGKLIR